jgi:trehalose/maltose transport system permease protein
MTGKIGSLGRSRTAWAFLAPMLLVLAMVAGWPLGRTIWFALTDANLGDLPAARFVGLDNFSYLLTDGDFWLAAGNTFRFALFSVALETILGLAIALVLHREFAGRGFVRAAVLVPWAIPTVVSAKMWSWMLNDVFGIINVIGVRLGLLAAPVAWAASPDTALLSVVVVDVWKTTPFMTLLILAGLQVIPAGVYEAARMDGAGPISTFFRITLPLLKPALAVAIIFRALDALRMFDLVYVLTGNSKSTMTLSVFARQNLVEFQDVGYGSAVATLLFAFIALFTVVYLTAMRIDGEEKA